MENREKFEALPRVAKLIKQGEAFYCNKGNYYLCLDIDNSAIELALDIAWYAFQEQENKIKALEKELEMRKQGAMVMSHHRDEVLSICCEYWCDDDRDYNTYIQRIQELLE